MSDLHLSRKEDGRGICSANRLMQLSSEGVRRRTHVPRRSARVQTTSGIQIGGFDRLPSVTTSPERRINYSEWFEKHVLRSRWSMFYVAFYMHWITLLCLAAVCCDAPEDYLPITLNAVFSAVPSASVKPVEDVLITTISEPPAEQIVREPVAESSGQPEDASEPEAEVFDKADLVTSDELPGAIESAESTEQSERDADRPGELAAVRPSVPAHHNLPPHAVTKGSFAVWTEPTHPKAGEPYRIIVQIRLPEKVKRYSTADLEGLVIGTDGYRKQIPGTVRAFLPILDGQVRLEVPIVSADHNVNDTIMIRSRMLREAQRLTLRF